MHSPDNSLIYPLLRILYRLIPNYIVSYQITLALLCATFTGVSMYCARRWQAPRFGILLVGALTATSPHLTFFAAQYPKNLLGSILFINFLALFVPYINNLYRACPSLQSGRAMRGFATLRTAYQPSRAATTIPHASYYKPLPEGGTLPAPLLLHTLLVLAAALANYFGHTLTLALVGVVVAAEILVMCLTRWWWVGLVGAVTIGAIGGIIWFVGVPSLPYTDRFTGLVQPTVQWLPYAFYQRMGAASVGHWWRTELVLASLVAVGIWWQQAVSSRAATRVLALLFGVLLFPCWSLAPDGMGYRLFVFFPLLVPLGVACIRDRSRGGCAARAKRSEVPTDRELRIARPDCKEGNALLYIKTGALLGLWMLGWVTCKSYKPDLHDAPNEKWNVLTNNILSCVDTSNIELLIAHNSLAEFFTFTTGKDALPWQPEYAVDTARLWRVAYGVKPAAWAYYLSGADVGRVCELYAQYALVPEVVWQRFAAGVRTAADEFWLPVLTCWENPHKMRPSYMLRKKGY
jgi:hypothetical protein